MGAAAACLPRDVRPGQVRQERKPDTRRPEGQDRLPVQPQGGVDHQVRQVGAQTGQGQEGRTAGVHGCRAVQADAGDVLRRHGERRRQRRRRRWRSCSRCCVPLEKPSKGEKADPAPGRVQLGQRHQLSGVRHPGAGEVHPVRLRRHPDPGGLHGEPGGDAVTTDPKQNPTSGSLRRRQRRTPWSTGDTLALVAYQEYGDPQLWRPLAAYNGIDDPMRIADGTRVLLPTGRSSARRGRLIDMATSASFLVEIDGTDLPDDVAELLTSAYVDDSLRLPDLFMLRFRDPEPHRGGEVRGQDRLQGDDLASQHRRRRRRSS